MSLNVRVRLDNYNHANPAQKLTQVYVEIPDVARVSWLLPGEMFPTLRDKPWGDVLNVAHDHETRSGFVGWTAPEVVRARARVREWLGVDENADELQAAYEADHARRDPVTRKLLTELERLRAQLREASAGAGVADELYQTWQKRAEAAEARVAELEPRAASLAALEAAGVDNWEGYEDALAEGGAS